MSIPPILAASLASSVANQEKQRCHSAKDGECIWKDCPQLRDNEPHATGRDCPLYPWDEDLYE